MTEREQQLFLSSMEEGIREQFFNGIERISRNQMKIFLKKVGGFYIRKTGFRGTMECGAGCETEYTIYQTSNGKQVGRGITPWDALRDMITTNVPARYHMLAGLYEHGYLKDRGSKKGV